MNTLKYLIAINSCMILFAFSSAAFAAQTATATFAGGCFWTMQYDFDKVPGVVKTTVGYTGGHVANPSYEQVSGGETGHDEAVQVTYDPTKISYQQLLDFYWHNIDPTNASGQFCDTGEQYHTAIFYHDKTQQELAEASKQQLIKTGKFAHIVTAIQPAPIFYPAENYHQEFYQKSPVRFESYEYFCGRAEQLRKLWGK